MSAVSEQQAHLLHHALGLNPERRTAYRNYFLAGEGHHDMRNLEALESSGLMVRRPAPAFCESGDVVFCVTEAGKDVALDTLPPPPKYSRYDEYLRSESCDSFGEWLLGDDLPEMETDWWSSRNNKYQYRMKSRKATGEWKPTKKEAKASYKAALRKARS